MLLYITVLMWHMKALISLEWRNWTGWYLLSFFSIWIISKAIKCWKGWIILLLCPSWFHKSSKSINKLDRIASFLSWRGRSRPRDRVQACLIFSNIVCGAGCFHFRQKALSLSFASPPFCPSAFRLRQSRVYGLADIFSFPRPSVIKFTRL